MEKKKHIEKKRKERKYIHLGRICVRSDHDCRMDIYSFYFSFESWLLVGSLYAFFVFSCDAVSFAMGQFFL